MVPNHTLLKKYNIPAPRYTSYPTVPQWEEQTLSKLQWPSLVQASFAQQREISLYIHLPFCQQLCTYCGCHKYITKNHSYEVPYIEAVLKEWKMYLDIFEEKPIIKELHLGGGTPTFFSPTHLSYLIEKILEKTERISIDDVHFSFEAHPNNTTIEHLKALYKVGFRRMSLGVQDVGDDIMTLINRSQNPKQIIDLTVAAREIGYTSINYDLIYGLPKQTLRHIEKTMDYIYAMQPDRIAFYSYAHVPWKSPGQRAYSEDDLPMGLAKQALFNLGQQKMEQYDYRAIGMDHFTLAHDELYLAQQEHQLHRNFMGYTSFAHPMMIGLGASAISDTWTAFAQNEKDVKRYQQIVNEGELAFFRGHQLNSNDLIIRRHILNLMCNFETEWTNHDLDQQVLKDGLLRMDTLQEDGLVKITGNQIVVTDTGKPFIRNICLALDYRYWQRKEEQGEKRYSMTI